MVTAVQDSHGVHSKHKIPLLDPAFAVWDCTDSSQIALIFPR